MRIKVYINLFLFNSVVEGDNTIYSYLNLQNIAYDKLYIRMFALFIVKAYQWHVSVLRCRISLTLGCPVF